MCSLKYPEVTISSIARTAATTLATSAFAVLKDYRKQGNALGFNIFISSQILQLTKFIVHTLLFHELCRGTQFMDSAFMQNDYSVGLLDG